VRATLITTIGLVLALAALVAGAAPATAEPLRVGVFAPATPFDGTGARLEFATRLARHIGGDDAVGRVYGKAGDFASALKKGDIDLAVVDASYLAAAGGSYAVLAVAVRGGDTRTTWDVVARGTIDRVLDLKGKTVLVPSVGGRETAFVLEALLGGELPADFFEVESSPDVLSAIAALGLGKAEAAVVPSGLSLPAGTNRVVSLPAVSWPLLIASPRASADAQARAAERAPTFGGSGPISGFRAATADAYKSLARRFGRTQRRGPMVLPNLRMTVGELIEGRAFSIDPGDARRYVAR
jgi:ABC-type amino acid transport substrate-binding protein